MYLIYGRIANATSWLQVAVDLHVPPPPVIKGQRAVISSVVLGLCTLEMHTDPEGAKTEGTGSRSQGAGWPNVILPNDVCYRFITLKVPCCYYYLMDLVPRDINR